MKQHPSLHLLLVICLGMMLLSSCVNLLSFQSAKPIDKGTVEINIAGGGYIVPVPFSDDPYGVPYLEVGSRLGIDENVDIGLKMSSTSIFNFDMKVQVVGDKLSEFAIAPGPGIGYFRTASGTSVFNASIPLHMSYHQSDRFAIYFTPRYTALLATDDGNLNYLGGSIGFLTGKKIQFGLEIGYGNLLDDDIEGDIFEDLGIDIWQFGFGFKFPLGQN